MTRLQGTCWFPIMFFYEQRRSWSEKSPNRPHQCNLAVTSFNLHHLKTITVEPAVCQFAASDVRSHRVTSLPRAM